MKRIAEAKVVAEVEEQWRVAAVVKVQAMEAEIHCVTEQKLVVVAVVRHREVLEDVAKVETMMEEVETEQGGGSLLKQKGQAEGEWVACN